MGRMYPSTDKSERTQQFHSTIRYATFQFMQKISALLVITVIPRLHNRFSRIETWGRNVSSVDTLDIVLCQNRNGLL